MLNCDNYINFIDSIVLYCWDIKRRKRRKKKRVQGSYSMSVFAALMTM